MKHGGKEVVGCDIGLEMGLLRIIRLEPMCLLLPTLWWLACHAALVILNLDMQYQLSGLSVGKVYANLICCSLNWLKHPTREYLENE